MARLAFAVDLAALLAVTAGCGRWRGRGLGMAGFGRVMEAVDDAWRNRRADLLTQAGKLHDALARTVTPPLDGVSGTEPGTEIGAPKVDSPSVERAKAIPRQPIQVS